MSEPNKKKAPTNHCQSFMDKLFTEERRQRCNLKQDSKYGKST